MCIIDHISPLKGSLDVVWSHPLHRTYMYLGLYCQDCAQMLWLGTYVYRLAAVLKTTRTSPMLFSIPSSPTPPLHPRWTLTYSHCQAWLSDVIISHHHPHAVVQARPTLWTPLHEILDPPLTCICVVHTEVKHTSRPHLVLVPTYFVPIHAVNVHMCTWCACESWLTLDYIKITVSIHCTVQSVYSIKALILLALNLAKISPIYTSGLWGMVGLRSVVRALAFQTREPRFYFQWFFFFCFFACFITASTSFLIHFTSTHKKFLSLFSSIPHSSSTPTSHTFPTPPRPTTPSLLSHETAWLSSLPTWRESSWRRLESSRTPPEYRCVCVTLIHGWVTNSQKLRITQQMYYYM